MFYEKNESKALRFGDILKGYCYTTVVLEKPVLDGIFSKYEISVSFQSFSVLLSPCCQIERGTICLSPLIPIRPSFFENPYFAEDFTRINKQVTFQQSVPPKAYKEMGQSEREKREAEGLKYAFPYLFVFEPHAKLPPYDINDKEGKLITTGYYAVDFKNMMKVNCKEIKSAKESPLDSKVVELSIESRKALGDKLASYFGTLAKEDLAILEAE